MAYDHPEFVERELILIRRIYEEKQILGHLLVMKGDKIEWNCKTLELPWRKNERNVSSIPAGRYPLVLEFSPAFSEELYELKEVPGRSEIKIHVANLFTELRGCIGVGDMFMDMNRDGFRDLRNSRKTLNKLHRIMDGQPVSWITILDCKR